MALRAVLEIGNSSIFEQFRAVFKDFCLEMLGSNFVKALENCSKNARNKSPAQNCSNYLKALENSTTTKYKPFLRTYEINIYYLYLCDFQPYTIK